MSAPVKKCEVTPLEALRRLYEVARKVDASEAGDFETLLQGELAVVEAVLRDAAMGKIIDQIADTWPMKKYTLEEIEDGLRALVANPANFAPSAAPVVPVAAQPVVQQEPVAWLVYAEDNNGMVPQFPAYQVKQEALRYAATFGQTRTEIWPIYAAPSLEAQPAGEVIDQRSRFEEWAKRTHTRPGTHFSRSHNGVYKDNRIAAKWAAWSAAMAQGEKP